MFFGSFLRADRVDPLKQLSSRSFIEKFDGEGVAMKVPDVMVKEWFDFDFLRLIDRMDVDPILTLVAGACLCEID